MIYVLIKFAYKSSLSWEEINKMKQAVVPLYIRFGEIPKDEKSKVYRSDSIVREEAGVSVWRAIENCGCYYPILP